ncbi:hypothetical protein ACWIID_38915 [Streptomyces phaeochromogenes]
MESPVLGDGYAGFGERHGETDQWRHWQPRSVPTQQAPHPLPTFQYDGATLGVLLVAGHWDAGAQFDA